MSSEEHSILRELEQYGSLTTFRKSAAGHLQGRNLVSSAPAPIEALAFKVEDDGDDEEKWHVDRRPFEATGVSYRGKWTLEEEGLERPVEFTAWPGYFIARLMKGDGDE